jgi:hypothetical protein
VKEAYDLLAGLVAEKPDDKTYQRDLSVAHDEVGDVLVARGNLTEALEAYRDSLAISERLAKADPGNAGWQYDLGISHERIGDVLVERDKEKFIERLTKRGEVCKAKMPRVVARSE